MAQLEAFYVQFNTARPEDFRGHSLSVSDIVALKVGGVVSCHYVDSIGFKELENFALRENYLKNAEMAMEDDYNSNGRKDEPETERHSVLDALKALSGAEQTKRRPPQKQAGRDER